MDYSVQDKTVLVTGASSGIGAALAEGLAAAGATVGICARRTQRLEEVLSRVREHAPESRAWTVDLSQLDGIAEFAARVVDEMGGVDVLVNNAGIPKRRRVQDLTPGVVESVMAINYYSPVRLTLALLDELTARAGRIVNISSIAARLGPPSEAAYSASKAALSAWSESLQVDLAVGGSSVRVHVVNPGVIDTDLFHLPDNEESMADLEALPATAMVQPVLDALANDTFETYVPDWFADVVSAKFGDPDAFLEGSIAWARRRRPS